MKRIIKIIGIIIGLFIITAILIPILFKGKIIAFAKKEMNEQLNATSDFKDISISLFRHFPNLSVKIEDIYIANKAPFAGDTLISANSIDVSVDLLKAIKGNYDIVNVVLTVPRIHALVDQSGVANWNITKPDTSHTAAQPSKPFSFKLQHYEIDNGFIEYKDDQGKMYTTIENLNHSGSGDFTSDAFTLATKTSADALSFTYGNIAYLSKVKTVIDADIQVDNKTNKYSFNTDKIQLNGLKLNSKGFFQMPDTLNKVMDITFNTPSNDFKDILSLIPGIYQNNFKDIKTSGKLQLNGFVKGTMNATQMPAYQVNLVVENGSFQYPSLLGSVSDIQIKMQADNPDGITDHTVVNMEKGHLNFGTDPFDFHLLMKTPISNLWVDAAMKGKIDLAQVEKFMKLEAGTKLTGVINADASFKGSVAAAKLGKYDQVAAAGTIGIINLMYASKSYPDGVSLASLLLTFNPKNVTISSLKGNYLQTNFEGDGSIDNLLGYYLHNEILAGTLHVSVDKLDVNKWMGTPSTTQPSSTPSTGAFIVPANLNVTVAAKAGSVKYDNLILTSVAGTLAIHDETVYLQNITGNGLDGTLKIDGTYSTKTNKKNPDIALSYDVQNLDVQKTFTTFVTVQKMMPVAKYIAGKMTSQLSLKGKIGADMMPVMNSLTGKGNLLLLNGAISNFAPLQAIADKLGITQLHTVALNDIKNFFSFENGRVIIDPYQFKANNISFQVAGSHGFDQSIQYGVNMIVPRSMMGNSGNAVVNDLASKAAKNGVAIKMSDNINLAVKIGGTLTAPKIQTDLKDIAGNVVDDVKKQVQAEAQKRIDSVKKVATDSVKKLGKQAVTDVANSYLKGNDSNKNNTVNDIKDKAKTTLKGLFKK